MKFTLTASEAHKVFRPLEEATAYALKHSSELGAFVRNWGMTPNDARTFFREQVYPAIDAAIKDEKSKRRF